MEKVMLRRLAKQVLGSYIEPGELDQIIALVSDARKGLDEVSSLIRNNEPPIHFIPKKVNNS